MTEPLLRIKGLVKHYPGRRRLFGPRPAPTRAIDGISFDIHAGETLGLVGESGCGKSTTGRAILQLVRPTAGQVRYRHQDLTALPAAQMRDLRREMQMIFQDPYSSLDPRMRVADLIAEPLDIHGIARGPARREKVAELLDAVGLPASALSRYPHEFSGGQRQRIGIARALALSPKFIVADEAVSALDVSIQAQVINLMQDLQDRLGLTYLFISHNLNVVRHISDRVGVMYLGQLVEIGTSRDVFARPLHPYTRALIDAAPSLNARRRERVILQGEVPKAGVPRGCIFRSRCPEARALCATDRPQPREADGRLVACHNIS
ncbi:ATP-binding cassette domain-containing protein [Paracoccus limosus]|uniref:ATP-binding cassette domain-containing protein n=1 Tax=Paracoccus limosus TaxID=913252 RepID=A0A844HAM9_9RHOB|nr:oligopeptide/dipeptide ABC transporter ATP-binding protein [Paracoccus limosus]MTH35957.1 ATP-binding cassette domain-containing protein [Paracoccus limosus]